MTITYAAKRPAAPIITTLLNLLEAGDLEGIKSAVRKYTGGAIHPFEYDAFEIVRDIEYAAREKADAPPLTLDHIREMWDSIKDDPQYTWAFEPGQQVVCVSDNGNLKRGETYTVLGCIIGQSWSGDEEYVHLDIPENAGREKPVGYGTGSFVDRDLWNALTAARENDGVLYESRGVYTNVKGRTIAAETVKKLVARGAMRLDDEAAYLRESSWLLKKCGLKLAPAERLKVVLSRHAGISLTESDIAAVLLDLGLQD